MMRSSLPAVLLCSIAVLLSGCSATPAPLTANGATDAFVVQQTGVQTQEVLRFALSQNGAVTPRAALGLPNASINALTVDGKGQLYVADSNGIEVYDAASFSSSSKPTRVMQLTSVPFDAGGVYALAVDAANNLYVAMETAILEYTQNTGGALTLQRSITGFLIPGLMTVDKSGNLYVILTSGLAVYAPTASGNAAPAQLIRPSNNLAGFSGLAVDASGNIYTSTSDGGGSPPALVEYAPGATGVATPLRTITVPSLGLGSFAGIQIDASGNVYAILNSIGSSLTNGATPHLLGIAPGQSGSVVPAIDITSSSWTFANASLGIH